MEKSYTDIYKEYISEKSNLLEIMKESEFFKALMEQLPESEHELLLEKMKEQAAAFQPVVDDFLKSIENEENAQDLIRMFTDKQ